MLQQVGLDAGDVGVETIEASAADSNLPDSERLLWSAVTGLKELISRKKPLA